MTEAGGSWEEEGRGGWMLKVSFVTQRRGRGRGGAVGEGVMMGWGVSSDYSQAVINAGVFHNRVRL